MSIISLVTVVSVLAGLCSASPVSRIVNGTPTTVETYPSIVQLDFFNPTTNTWSHNCGANILNELYMLSAAHCTDPIHDPHFSTENRRIRAGATNRNSGGVIRNVASVLNHPEYNERTYLDADICIIRLRELLTFGDGIRNVAILPQGYVIPDNAPVTHAGWGSVGNGPAATELLYVDLVHMSNCNGISQSALTEYMICAGSPTGGTDGACSGDSGGPLYIGEILAGVVSWGAGGCLSTTPTVSARVTAFTNWILENTP